MKTTKKFNLGMVLSRILHYPSMVLFILISALFVVITFHTFFTALLGFVEGDLNHHQFIAEIFLVFLYLEIVAAIKIYFQQNFHFPLRFFVYIGITDLVRYIIVVRESATETLLYAGGVLLLIVALTLLEMKNKYIGKTKFITEQSFEL